MSTETIDYLLGLEDQIMDPRFTDEKGNPYPPVATPIRGYLEEVDRFLFKGGLTIASPSGQNLDYVQTLYSPLAPYLTSLWERVSVCGELLAYPIPDGRGSYVTKWFEKQEYQLTEGSVYVERRVYREGVAYSYRLEIHPDRYVSYPLVKWAARDHAEWARLAQTVDHNYQELPAFVFYNRRSVRSERGVSDFDQAAIATVALILQQFYDRAEVDHFFGHPLIDTPLPTEVANRLKRRIQVLPKEPSQDGGGTSIIQPKPYTAEQLEFADTIYRRFRQNMGIRAMDTVETANTSSRALRVLNSQTIATAEEKQASLIRHGLEPYLGLLQRMGKVDGFTGLIVEDTRIKRAAPYFPKSPDELVLEVQAADHLIQIGVDAAKALQMSVFQEYTLAEVQELLSGNSGV